MFKDFTIIGPDSVSAAHTANCASEQKKFWEYHDVLYNNWNGENNGWASNDNLLIFANEIGLDINKLKECNDDGRYKSIIEASNDDARLLGLTGTPAFFIISNNDVQKIIGAQPYEVFENIFETMLEK
jgi:protein-disulfide isomerase